MKNILNTISSFFFTSNVLHLSKKEKKDYIYYISFYVLLISSVIFHSTQNYYLGFIDRMLCYNIVYQGCIRLFKKNNFNNVNKIFLVIITIILFLFVVYLYIFGYIYKKYCFSTNTIEGENYHSLLHLLSSLGHHIIIYLS